MNPERLKDTLFPIEDMRRGATFSHCRGWRYTLDRFWDDALPRILFILLNPSNADAFRDDPTNTRGINFAKAWGFGACIFANLFAFRTPRPALMKVAAWITGLAVVGMNRPIRTPAAMARGISTSSCPTGARVRNLRYASRVSWLVAMPRTA